MGHSEICPVCKGEGELIKYSSCYKPGITVTCHGCGGQGWIVVPGKYECAFNNSEND